jgi:glycerophosphoryl diester phosphodiesterase
MPNELPAWRPLVIAHRGGVAWTQFPENSAEGFAAAWEAGYPCECDVQVSADGEPVVLHDSTLDRTTMRTGSASELPWDELQAVRLRDQFGEPSASTIPLLRDVARWVSFVEVKPVDAPKLVERVVEIMAGFEWTLQSFDPANLHHARKIDPAVRTALLVNQPDGIDTAIARKWPAYLDHTMIGARGAARLREAGLAFGAWTVNTENELHHILPFRPDVIITDVPRLMTMWLERCGIPRPAVQ